MEMRLVGDSEADLELISVTDNKKILVDRLLPYSMNYLASMETFKNDEKLVGVVIQN